MMRAPFEICRTRNACAILASGVVISLTALTGGIAPAFAAPGGGGGGAGDAPTTTVEAPPKKAPKEDAPSNEAPAEKPTAADVPSVDATAPVAVAPTASQTVEAPPVTRALAPAPSADTPTQTRAPQTASTPAPAVTSTREAPSTTVTSEAPPAPRDLPSSSTAAPVTSATPGPERSEPSSSSSPSPSSSTPATTSGSSLPSPALVAPTSGAPTQSGSSPASTPTSDSPGSSPESSPESSRNGSTTATTTASSSSQAAQRVIQKVAPQTLEAPDADVQIAQSAKIVEQKPDVAPKQEIDDISRVIDLPNRDNRDRQQPFDRDHNRDGQRDGDRDRDDRDRNHDWDHNVRQWRPDWVQYDEYYRPVLSNPYRDPVRIVYIYQNRPRVAFIPPLARIVLEVAQYAAYSFTAVVQNTVQQAANVAVGSFFGGGYYPGVGFPPPPPPPPLLNYANVPVQVRYSDATYEPFRVNKIVDVGDDAQYGERKVLLDGVTPAWGQWRQTPAGERSFEVHKTQQFPGLDDPQEAPLPGDYQLRLASDETPAGVNSRDIYMIAVALTCGVLSIGAVVLAVFMGRRRRAQH